MLAVDIDETIAATVDEWMKKLLEEFPIDGAPEAHALIKEYRYAQNVPQWKENAVALARMQEFRECPVFHLEIPPIPDSATVLSEIARSLQLEYLTMRNPKVTEATRVWLEQNGFPKGNIQVCPIDIPLSEKPNWKASILAGRQPQLVGIIEDHPQIIQSLPSDYKGTVFFFSHHTSPRSDINVIPCPTWDHVARNVQRELPRLLAIDPQV